ncbi:MAG TPA: hypothetical protein VK789_27525 [Bryobacteraceae bacterium]|nr:hypothetical protein [Bryobacteraceae bacterium]
MQEQLTTYSRKSIAAATGVALAVALLVLFVAVLPAEYGIDPLKTGAALGLVQLAKTSEKAPAGAAPKAPVQTGVYTAQPAVYKVDSEDLSLRPGEGVEIKYHMQKGAGMVYSWKANGNVAFEFHGEPDNKPNKDYFESYELDDKVGKDHSFGSFTAPTTGIHGWFWENKTKKEVSIHLTTAGFYDSAKMYSDGPPDELTIEDVK